MAKKTGLTRVAEKVGKAVGTADRRAHETVKKVQHATKVAKGELHGHLERNRLAEEAVAEGDGENAEGAQVDLISD